MFCPGCGAETSEAMKFCRSCGMELQRVAEIVSESRAVIGSDPVHAAAIQGAGKGGKMLTQAGNAMTIAAIVAFCILLVSLVPLGIARPPYMDSLVLWFIEGDLLLFLAGIGLKAVPRLLRQRVGKTRASTTRLPSADPPVALSPVTPGSVTEQTTKSLAPQVVDESRHGNG
jgi:hypothetical protein